MRVICGIATWLAILAIALCIPSVAARDATIPRLGVLLPPGSPAEDGLRQGLRELGYIEGESIIIDWRRAEGGYAELPRLADDLVRSQVDAIVAGGDAASMAATQATTSIPIVFMSGDPISAGLTTNLSHPFANRTGVYVPNTDLEAKRLELLLEVAPRARRVAYLRNPSNPLAPRFSEKVEHAAAALGVRVLSLNARNGTEVASALKGISKKDMDGVLVGGDILFLVKRADIARTIHDAGLPAVFPWKSYHDYGALVSYGVNVKAVGVRAALYVAKILKGTKPVDLPVEEISQFELVVDLREARGLKIDVPQSVLIRATEVMR